MKLRGNKPMMRLAIACIASLSLAGCASTVNEPHVVERMFLLRAYTAVGKIDHSYYHTKYYVGSDPLEETRADLRAVDASRTQREATP